MLPKKLEGKYLLNYLKDLLTNNKRYKLIALLLAAIAWATVAVDINSKIEYTTNLQITLPADSNLVIVGDINRVTLTLWGPSNILRNISDKQVKVYLDIKKPVKGENVFELNSRNVFVPKKVKVLSIDPGVIKLNFQKLNSKTGSLN